ncbi:DUF3861 domain-containing protein [Lysobacter sp. CA199]|uniref:DUF3861 domain-containing protein n=1 Tax=Lysobacter sp. CA199 TaxID=3455608 RepID=UPI003F8D6E8E
MKPYRYRIHVQALDSGSTAPITPAGDSLRFDVAHHDELLSIVDKVRRGTGYPADDAAALAVGLKLLSAVMLDRRKDPLFADVRPALRAFIGNLKARTAEGDGDVEQV